MKPIYTFEDAEQEELKNQLLDIGVNPYKAYTEFQVQIANLISSGKISKSFVDALQKVKDDRASATTYAHVFGNCPVDDEIPQLDQDDALNDKYAKKKTFVGEGLLELQAQFLGTPILAYTTRNNGDFFQDVYADNKFNGTQTQKTDGELYWHNERTAHPVRADFISLLGMRTPGDDLVYTKYVDGRELLKYIPQEHQETLRESAFITPFDELSKASNSNQVVSDAHAMLENEHSFRYYDTRTVPADPNSARHYRAIGAFRDALSKAQEQYHRIKDRDLFLFANQDGLHSRQMVDIQHFETTRFRWLLKTYTFRDDVTADSNSAHWLNGVRGQVKD